MILDSSTHKHLQNRKRVDRLFAVVCQLAASLGVVLLIVFMVKIFIDGVSHVNWKFITGELSSRPGKTGLWPAIVGSAYVMALTTVISVPVGVAAAIYLEEFTRRKTKFTSMIQLNISNLSGVPSIVYGLLGRVLFVYYFGFKQSIIAGALTMTLLILPTVIIVTQEALRAVPKSYRDGSMALGSTQWQAIRLQVLPNALPGILTGGILAVSRAAGEVAPILFTGVAYYMASLPHRLNDQFMDLGYHVFVLSTQSPDIEKTRSILFATVVVLLLLTFTLNFVAVLIRSRVRKKLRSLA